MKNQIVLLDVAIKTGIFSKGTKQGQPYCIGVCKYADASGRTVSRISQNPEASMLFKGEKIAGSLKQAKTNPYTFKGLDGKEVVASTKWVVRFDGESLEQAIFAHGRQPLGYVAKTQAALTPVATADARP